jgi:sec-independent protein translocase protein TatA
MAFDDPIVWLLIVGIVVLLFGASRIPKLARAFGEARREYKKGERGEDETGNNPPPSP